MRAQELTDFFDWLRSDSSGFEAGDQQYLMAQDLVGELIDQGQWPAEAEEWRILLAPVFCSSPSQQNQFYQDFRSWFPSSGGKTNDREKSTDNRRTSKWRINRNLVVVSIFVLLALLLGIWVGSRSPGKSGGQAKGTAPNFALGSRSDFLLITSYGTTLLSLAVFLALHLRNRGRRLEIRKWTKPTEPRMRQLGLSVVDRSFYASADARKLATALRRRRSLDSQEIDIESTVHATARNGGYFSQVMAKRNKEPEYLWLGERKNPRDHKSRLDDELIRRLRGYDVAIRRYYFQTDPHICTDAKGNTFALSELAAIHAHHELWLQLDARGCVDPVTGDPRKWWSHIHLWHHRVLFSFEPAGSHLEVRVVQPTIRGLAAVAMGSAQEALPSSPLPTVIQQHPESWLRNVEPPPAVVSRLFAQLRTYLNPDEFLLLQACAVYPIIAWDVTVTLAIELLPKRTLEPILNRLSILPWFRHGMMPDWLRIRLVTRLGEHEERVRSALRKYVESSAEMVRQREETLKLAAASRRPDGGQGDAGDYVFLSFAQSRRLDRLAVEGPQRWKHHLRESGASFELVIAIVMMIAVPATFALLTVNVPPSVDAAPPITPFGFTMSLLLFLVPILAISFWFLPKEGVRVSHRSFFRTIAFLFPLLIVIDFLFTRNFFVFPNSGATLRIAAPALGGGVPVEQYLYHVAGVVAALITYIWLDEYWFAEYSVPGDATTRTDFDRLLHFHPRSALLGIALLAGAFAFRMFFVSTPGFPGYFLALVVVALGPSMALFSSALPVVNWRAFGFTLVLMLLINLLLEATLAMPYGWWGFRDSQMIGIYITAWSRLPIEEVFVWCAFTYSTVLVYEIIRRWQSSGKRAMHAFLGQLAARAKSARELPPSRRPRQPKKSAAETAAE
jgi:hypothetical protein